MGTRHQTVIINKAGDRKVSQYGQWDGYPSGQGVAILTFLKSVDLSSFEESVSKLKEFSEGESKLDKLYQEFDQIYEKFGINRIRSVPQLWALSRDCGSDLLNLINDSLIDGVVFISDAEAHKWCEGFYIIDFSKNIFEIVYHKSHKIYNLDNLPDSKQFLEDLK